MPRLFVPVSVFVFLQLAALAAIAQSGQLSARTCPTTDDQNNCVRILACIGQQGNWFNGRAYGRGKGALLGVTSDGAQCTGVWTSRNAVGLGQAMVQCDDGMRVTVLYTYQDEYTGTAIGRGVSNRGEIVRAWSGLNVLDYLRDPESASPEVSLPCGPVDIPIS